MLVVTDSCWVSNKIFTKCFFIFRSSVPIMWARQCASCFKAASWPFTATQGHLLKVSSFSSSCLSWESNVFSNFCSTTNDSCGFASKNWEKWCERPFVLRGLKFIAISAAKHLTWWVQMNHRLFRLPPTHWLFTPDSPLCSSVFAGLVFLVWYRGKSFKYTQPCFV